VVFPETHASVIGEGLSSVELVKFMLMDLVMLRFGLSVQLICLLVFMCGLICDAVSISVSVSSTDVTN
jgi:hypothetical protein